MSAELVFVIGTGALLVLAAAGIPLGLAYRARRIVEGTSAALAGLTEVNARYAESVMPLPVLTRRYHATTTSKSAFDRFQLRTFLMDAVLDEEARLAFDIEARLERMQRYSSYTNAVTELGSRSIGRSTDERIRTDRYATIERRLFHNRILSAPTPLATVTAVVSYTSPQGRNSYRKHLDWSFAELRVGLDDARRQRAAKSTTEYLRRRERSLLTPKMRTDILRRDGSRCRMCGASASTGAVLHVDHIVPVSHGGRTELGNLQTLCQSCNLGKSNRFVG
ncbi:HNH endonuclease [Microbacterium sp. B19]|uniref:HNH endonuclease n=1 Tax=Microbacterium sp. B19 TaxID=96765 RepID=UPI000344DB65|nr:HNH endonuclease signature motif containing protein [Microbacterium sp. B19]